MKKRVRIYKSQTGEGQFLNKAAQFLRKAQMGGTPSVEDLSYPGQAQAQGQAEELDDNQLASLVMTDISNSRPKEEIVIKLVNIYGKDPMEATNFVNEMYQYLQDQSDAQKQADEEEEDEDSDAVNTGAVGDAEAEATVVDNGDDTDNDGFYGDDSSNDAANQVADEDDEVEDDDTDVASQVVMRGGGYMIRADEGMEIQNQYPITFPGIEAYLPANMSDMLSGGYDVATGQSWERPEPEVPETSDDAGISYAHMEQGADTVMGEDAAPEGIPTEESEYRKGGSYKRDKTAYVNSVLKLVKKQMGGTEESNDPNDLVKKSDQSDPIGANLRKGILQSYIGTLKNQGQLAVAKEEAEQAYDQMMQQQMMSPSEQYPIEDGSLDEAQFGGFFNRRRGEEGYQRRGLFNRQPRLPRGFNQGYPPIESVDVRRTGLFGRPKEYSVQFGQMPSVMPGYGRPGVGPGFYGYGYKSSKKTPGRKIVEDNAVYVNSQAIKDVAAVTPGNDATNKEGKVEEKKTETTTITPAATTATGTTDPNAATTTTTTTDTKTIPTVTNSSTTAKTTQIKKDVKKVQNTNKISKPQGAKPDAPTAPRYFTPSPTPSQAKAVPNINMVMARANNPLAFAKTDMINDPKQKAAAVNKIMFPYRQEGGMVDDPFSDEYGALQRFVYGGDEDPALAYIDQSDLNGTYSKDTTDGYFQEGGTSIRAENPTDAINPKTGKKWTWDEWHSPGGEGYESRQKEDAEWKTREEALNKREEALSKIQQPSDYPNYNQGYPMQGGRRANTFNTLFPANIAPYNYTKFMGARNAQGQRVMPMLGANANIKSIDVRKTGWLTGRPKKYSITFGQESSDPRKQNLITLPGEGAPGSTPTKGQGSLSPKEVEKGERQAGRQRPLFAARRYEKDFEEYDLTPEEQKKIDENEARHKANRETESKQKANALGLYNKVFNPTAPMTAGQKEQFKQTVSNPSGISGYGAYDRGGALQRFIPQAQFGGNNPVVYTNNPAMNGISEVDLVTLNPGIQGLQGGLDWSSMSSPGTVTQQNNDGTKTYGVDASYKGPQQEQIEVGPGSHQIEQTYEPEGDVTLDFKEKMAMDNASVQGSILGTNALGKTALGMVDRFQNKKREAKMYDNLTSDNLYATDPSRDRGDYDTNTGLYRANEMGQTWNSRSKQYGGENDYLNEDPDYVEGDEVDMTDEELADFIANGGEVEYL